MDAITNIVNEPPLNDVAEDLIIIKTIDYIVTTIEEEEEETEKAEMQCIVEDVMGHLLSLVCESPSPADGDAPDDESAVVIGDEQRCGGGDFVVHTTSPAKGAEVRNSLGDLVGWLDPGVIPLQQERAPPRPRRKRFQLSWRSFRRVFRGMLCCCARADV